MTDPLIAKTEALTAEEDTFDERSLGAMLATALEDDRG